MTRADLQSKLASPPASDVAWDAYCSGTKSWARGIVARTWFLARVEAMRRLGCGPQEVPVELVKEAKSA